VCVRVVVIAPPFYDVPPVRYGGIERVCHGLVEALVDEGHDVTLVAVGVLGTRAGFVATSPTAPTENVPDPVFTEVRHVLLADGAVRELMPDVVHDHTRTGLAAAAGRDCPTVVTVHAALGGPESHLDLYRAAAPAVSLVAVSQSQVADAPDLPWAGVVPNGVRLADNPRVRTTADYALYLGRLSWTKGVDRAVEATRRAGLPLLVAGDWTSPAEQAYVERVLEPLLRGDRNGHVTWVGPVDDAAKRRLFARAACLVLPLRWHEPFGLVAVEAMASGVPVVAIRAGAMPELVDDGRTGILCDGEAELPGAIAAAAAMDGEACRPWVERHFSSERMAMAYARVYAAAAAGA
jgi:glycosyltransferase involved in cell wall biosynthesis